MISLFSKHKEWKKLKEENITLQNQLTQTFELVNKMTEAFAKGGMIKVCMNDGFEERYIWIRNDSIKGDSLYIAEKEEWENVIKTHPNLGYVKVWVKNGN